MRIIGAKAHVAHMKRIVGEEMVQEIGKALYAGGQIIETEAEISITAGSVSGKNHVPSRPGEPPNRDTGHLDGNIETVQVEPLKVQVSSNAEYAAALEFGTAKMAERPYMRPAVAKKKDEVTKLVRDGVNITVKRTALGNPPG